jgi:hypothetical protein
LCVEWNETVLLARHTDRNDARTLQRFELGKASTYRVDPPLGVLLATTVRVSDERQGTAMGGDDRALSGIVGHELDALRADVDSDD